MKSGLRRSALGAAAMIAALMLSVLLMELGVRAFDLFASERALLRAQAIEAEVEIEAGRGTLPGFVVHPFRGWSLLPGRSSQILQWAGPVPVAREGLGQWGSQQTRANQMGYFSNLDDYRKIDAAVLAIGIFGGSVADQLAILGGGALIRAVRGALPEPRPRVALLNFASGGYKQPQQAVSLLEAAALGVELDVVINLDGYNEAVLGGGDAQAGKHPLFPSRRHWAFALELASQRPSLDRLERMGQIAAAERRQREIAAQASSGLSRYSRLAQAIAGIRLRRQQARSIVLEDQLQREVGEETESPMPRLEEGCLGQQDGCWQEIAEIWERSSRAMQALAESMGATYLHLLQPNQHLEGTKPLSREEQEHATGPTLQAQRLIAGYPYLRARADSLRANGIRFHDLADVFRDHPETLYRDRCCHLNRRGNEILAESIAPLVLASIRGEPLAPSQRAGGAMDGAAKEAAEQGATAPAEGAANP